MIRILSLCCALCVAWVGGAAHAQLRIGQTAGFTGQVAAGVKEVSDGALLYINSVNAKGGVAGQKIEVASLDDKFEPKLAGENAAKLASDKNILALFLARGTPHTEAILPVLAKQGIALIAPSTGAILLHSPVNPYVFNVRSTYQREAERSVAHLASIGITRIAVVHADDSFGLDGLEGANNGFKAAGFKAASVIKANRTKPEYATIVPPIIQSNAQAVLWIGSGTAVADGVRELRKAGSAAQVVTLSNNASSGFIKSLGDVARGVIVTQVFPNERALGNGFVNEAIQLAKAAGAPAITPANLEGFAAAKVLVEALRRAGAKPTRESILAALETIRKFDLGGGLEVSYSATDHTGLDFVDLSIIGDDGRFRR